MDSSFDRSLCFLEHHSNATELRGECQLGTLMRCGLEELNKQHVHYSCQSRVNFSNGTSLVAGSSINLD